MRRPVVAGNWKMHGSRAANEALLAELERALKPEWQVDVVVFPPYVYLADAVRMLEEADIAVGAQDVCADPVGAFTGQVAAAMLKDVGCSYVIVGHSERRRLYHEDDALVARKFAAVLQGRLDAGAVRRRDAGGARGGADRGGGRAAARRGDRDERGGEPCAGARRLRAGVGHRYGAHGLAEQAQAVHAYLRIGSRARC